MIIEFFWQFLFKRSVFMLEEAGAIYFASYHVSPKQRQQTCLDIHFTGIAFGLPLYRCHSVCEKRVEFFIQRWQLSCSPVGCEQCLRKECPVVISEKFSNTFIIQTGRQGDHLQLPFFISFWRALKTTKSFNPIIFVNLIYRHFDILRSHYGQVKKVMPFQAVPK